MMYESYSLVSIKAVELRFKFAKTAIARHFSILHHILSHTSNPDMFRFVNAELFARANLFEIEQLTLFKRSFGSWKDGTILTTFGIDHFSTPKSVCLH
jgi:hypothetical protein